MKIKVIGFVLVIICYLSACTSNKNETSSNNNQWLVYYYKMIKHQTDTSYFVFANRVTKDSIFLKRYYGLNNFFAYDTNNSLSNMEPLNIEDYPVIESYKKENYTLNFGYYNIDKVLKVNECSTIKSYNSDSLKFCLIEQKSNVKLNRIIIKDCNIYDFYFDELNIDDIRNSRFYYDINRKVFVKSIYPDENPLRSYIELQNIDTLNQEVLSTRFHP